MSLVHQRVVACVAHQSRLILSAIETSVDVPILVHNCSARPAFRLIIGVQFLQTGFQIKIAFGLCEKSDSGENLFEGADVRLSDGQIDIIEEDDHYLVEYLARDVFFQILRIEPSQPALHVEFHPILGFLVRLTEVYWFGTFLGTLVHVSGHRVVFGVVTRILSLFFHIW